jgi:glycerol-3-phosphate acyltransferase PlsX
VNQTPVGRPMVTVAVDAMGGDNAPQAIVAGALTAAAEGIGVLLVGQEARLRGLLTAIPAGARVDVVDAPDVIGSGDEPVSSVRSHPDASMVVAARLVAEGRADAAFSAGNTGAFVAASLLTVKRMRGVKRPAICTVRPAVPKPVVLLDAGANAEVRAEHLRQFAHMGQAFAREVLGIARPTVGLLSIGEEPGKGTALVIEAHALLAADAALDFFGNVEGRDLLIHKADVVVTDGFTGNVALKTAEGAGRALMTNLKSAVTAGTRGKIGALLLKRDLQRLRASLDPEEYGGQHLLGMSRPVVIGHGSSGERGAANAVRYAARAASGGMLAAIERELGAVSPAAAETPASAE